MLDLTQLETARSQSETDKKLLKWASIFKAETLEELEQLANGEEVFENMVVTMKQLSEDEKIRMQCEAREDYERCLITEYNAGKQDGIELERKKTEKERLNTEKERQRADAATKKAAAAIMYDRGDFGHSLYIAASARIMSARTAARIPVNAY